MVYNSLSVVVSITYVKPRLRFYIFSDGNFVVEDSTLEVQ